MPKRRAASAKPSPRQVEATCQRFIEHMGLFAEEDGLPRIAGRIWGLMLIEGGPLHFEEIADRLQVSRGSVSTNTRRLYEMRILERISQPGDRRDYWRLANRPALDLLARFAEKFEHREQKTRQVMELIAASRPDAAARLADRIQVYSAVAGGLREALDSLQE